MFVLVAKKTFLELTIVQCRAQRPSVYVSHQQILSKHSTTVLTFLSISRFWQAWQNLETKKKEELTWTNINRTSEDCAHKDFTTISVKVTHLSSRISSTGDSVKTSRGNRWWKDLARWGANTSVKPLRWPKRYSVMWTHCSLFSGRS